MYLGFIYREAKKNRIIIFQDMTTFLILQSDGTFQR